MRYFEIGSLVMGLAGVNDNQKGANPVAQTTQTVCWSIIEVELTQFGCQVKGLVDGRQVVGKSPCKQTTVRTINAACEDFWQKADPRVSLGDLKSQALAKRGIDPYIEFI